MGCAEQVSPREKPRRSHKVRECSIWWLQGGSMLSLQTCCLAIARSGRPLTCQSCRASCQPVSGTGRREGETTLLQANACCMIVIPRNFSQVGGFDWGGQIGFDTRTSETMIGCWHWRHGSCQAWENDEEQGAQCSPILSTSRYQHSPCKIIIQWRTSSNSDDERTKRINKAKSIWPEKVPVRFQQQTYISEKSCHLTNLHSELHPFSIIMFPSQLQSSNSIMQILYVKAMLFTFRCSRVAGKGVIAHHYGWWCKLALRCDMPASYVSCYNKQC